MPELLTEKSMGHLHEVQGPVVVIRCERMPPLRRGWRIEFAFFSWW